MDCDALEFHSRMAGWNAVSMATEYKTVVSDPTALKTREGTGVDEALRGFLVSNLNARAAARLGAEDAGLGAELKEGGSIALLLDPVTREPARLPDGRLLTIDQPKKGRDRPAGLESMVSWRSDVGVHLQVGGGAERFVTVLRESFPEVNVVRLDFNAESVDNAGMTGEWRDFALTAARAGLGLVIQNSDGDLAGGLKRPQPVELGPPDALAQVSGEWKINQVQADWQRMLDWFRRPENALILDAVVGWELINEPMAYGNKPEAGALYSRHMADLIGSLDWGGKRLFVGGLRASAQFEHLDHDLIREAAGDRLVWSAHMYPGWVVAKTPDPDGGMFRDQICRRIGTLTRPGDDIMVTESQLYTEAGSLEPVGGAKAAQSYNMARKLPWFADNGIGWTWWPPIGRASQMLRWNGSKDGYRVEIESAAFAHWGWVRDETQAPEGAAEHWGGAGDEVLTVEPSRGEETDHVVEGVSNPHGLIYALAGDDRVSGGELTDLLYGGKGGDSLEGGAGGDWLFGGQGDDYLDGGEGDDVLIDPEGANSLTGGPGNDHLEGAGVLDGGEGDDVLTATGDGTVLTGGPGSDRFLPPLRGPITFADFTPGEDKLDLSLLQTPNRAPTLELRGSGDETTLVWGELTVTMPGAAGLTEADIINAGPRRVVLTGD